ncbi:MAG: hypothetical protein DRP06_01795 [Candidatus Aenigmatarchaeota archaeon]|nr:MAG: hypothetical protein DRP06_01795 [Candidatus Aenigmarchaeota archaeon]
MDTELKLEGSGMTEEEIRGFGGEVEDLAMRCIGGVEIDKMLNGITEKYENEIKPKATEYLSKLDKTRQQTEELNKLQIFYQSLQ